MDDVLDFFTSSVAWSLFCFVARIYLCSFSFHRTSYLDAYSTTSHSLDHVTYISPIMPSDTSAASTKNIVNLAELLPAHLRSPQVGIVCGSGLATLAESITERVIVPYSALEGFGESTGVWRVTPLLVSDSHVL
jgi:hypothetical protein